MKSNNNILQTNAAHAEALRKAPAEPATLRDIIAEIDTKALKQLSDAPAFRFDYNKPVSIYRIRGAFTAAKVATLSDSESLQNCAIIIQTADDTQRGRVGRVCTFNDSSLEPIIIPYSSSLDNFYRKADINEARKIARNTFIIIQAQANRRGGAFNGERTGGLYLDASNRLARGERARGVKFDLCYSGHGGEFYNRVAGRLDDGGASFCIDVDYRRYPTTSPAPFDASGYYVAIRRDNLKYRAQQLRAERAKAEAQAHDFGAEIEEARAEIEETRRAIAEALANAHTWREVSRVEAAARVLVGAFQYLEIMAEWTAARCLSSIEEGRRKIDSAKNAAKKARATLAEVKQ